MFTRVSALLCAIAFAAPAVLAAPGGHGGHGHGGHGDSSACDVGTLQCCQSLQRADGATSQNEAGLLPIGLGNLGVFLGIECIPIAALVGLDGNSCSAQPACCFENQQNGLVALECTPVNLNV